jgi:tol-pal system-associated acyl-CoA thioesterase
MRRVCSTECALLMNATFEKAISLPIRVYLEDTDAQGIVYNASYFRFMERARTECLRACGIDHRQLEEQYGINLVLSRVETRFLAPARLSDILLVSAELSELKGARMIFEQSVRLDDESGELLCDGIAEVASIDIEANRPKRFPKALINEWM